MRVILIHIAVYRKVSLILLHMGKFDWFCHRWVSLTDIATYGSVWLILPHMGRWDWLCYIWISLTHNATNGSVWLILPQWLSLTDFAYMAPFDIYYRSVSVILLHTGKFDWDCYIQVSLPEQVSFTDVVTYRSVWLELPHMGQFESYCYIWGCLTDFATYGSVYLIL